MASTSPPRSLGQYLHAPRDLRLESKDLAPLGPDEVQISIRATTLVRKEMKFVIIQVCTLYEKNYIRPNTLVRDHVALEAAFVTSWP
jgi:hypothetical protein